MKKDAICVAFCLACIISVLVLAVVIFGGYGAILAGVLAAVGLADCASCCDPDGANK